MSKKIFLLCFAIFLLSFKTDDRLKKYFKKHQTIFFNKSKCKLLNVESKYVKNNNGLFLLRYNIKYSNNKILVPAFRNGNVTRIFANDSLAKSNINEFIETNFTSVFQSDTLVLMKEAYMKGIIFLSSN